MADLGLALSKAIPQSINNISAIEGIQERAKRLKMDEQLQPLQMEQTQQQTANLKTTNALNEVSLAQKAMELKKQKQTEEALEAPRTINDLFNYNQLSQIAPKSLAASMEDFKTWEGNKGEIAGADDKPVSYTSTARNFLLYANTNPEKVLGRFNQALGEVEATEISLAQELASAAGNEKKVSEIGNKLKQIQAAKSTLLTQTTAMKQAMGVKEDMNLTEWDFAKQNPEQYKQIQEQKANLKLKENKPASSAITNKGWTIYFDPNTKSEMATKDGSQPVYYNKNLHGDAPSSEASKLNIAVTSAEARGKAFADNKIVAAFDATTGHTVKVRGKIANDNPTRYFDPSDPDVKSYANITKSMDSISAFEKGASNALNLTLSVAKDYNNGKYPAYNQFSQFFAYNAGNPDVQRLRNSVVTAATEYVKVINAGSNLTAAELSVMGQKRANEMIKASDNFNSLQNSIRLMQKEMKISSEKNKTQRKEIGGRLGMTESSTGASGGQTAGGNRFTIKEVK